VGTAGALVGAVVGVAAIEDIRETRKRRKKEGSRDDVSRE